MVEHAARTVAGSLECFDEGFAYGLAVVAYWRSQNPPVVADGAMLPGAKTLDVELAEVAELDDFDRSDAWHEGHQAGVRAGRAFVEALFICEECT